jgi:hypothetical protein
MIICSISSITGSPTEWAMGLSSLTRHTCEPQLKLIQYADVKF